MSIPIQPFVRTKVCLLDILLRPEHVASPTPRSVALAIERGAAAARCARQ